jgi:hypothetical protein
MVSTDNVYTTEKYGMDKAHIVRPAFMIDMIKDQKLPDPREYEWNRDVTPQKLRQLCNSISRWITPNEERIAVALEKEELEHFTEDLIPTQQDCGMQVTYGSQTKNVPTHQGNSVDPLLSLLDE